MSPLSCEILLHYYSRAEDFRSGDFSAPAVRDSIDWFLKESMLERDGGDMAYRITERGRAWVDHILSRPFPVNRWVIG